MGGGPNYYGFYCGGVYFEDASDNTVYHNNFVNNKGGQAVDYDSVNIWDYGYTFGGNYWSDYSTRYPGTKQIGSSGVGDAPYVIDA